MPKTRTVNVNNITPPVESLEYYFRAGGVTIMQAAFAHSFFIDPDAVREKTPMYADRARSSRKHYPGANRGESATWSRDQRTVVIGDNTYAQIAWQRYTGCPIQRGSGYGVRHIWGNPWDPDAFTAGWNICYMPFWAGMLTEDQHLLEALRDAVRQASWDLYFRDKPVCEPPDFVVDPGVDLRSVLGEQPILIMRSQPSHVARHPTVGNGNSSAAIATAFDRVAAIRSRSRQSWSNLYKGALSLQEKPHEPFGTSKVRASSLSVVRTILRETEISAGELQTFLEQQTPIKDRLQ